MVNFERIFRIIAEKCPSSKDIKGGIIGDVGVVLSEDNEAWGWYNAYSSTIEDLLSAEGLFWAYAFERVHFDYPCVTMFFGNGDIEEKSNRILEKTASCNEVTLECARFKDICEQYNEFAHDELSQSIINIADMVIEVNKI